MKLFVGSKNINKVSAVRETALLYPDLFPDADVLGVPIELEEFGHPKSLSQVVEGAVDRAKRSFGECQYSFGLEGGLMQVPHTKSGFMEVNACALFDGKQVCLGLGPACEWPLAMTELVLSGKADGSQAFKQLGLTHHEKIGNVPGGIIGILTKGIMTREDFIKYSIVMAVMQLQNQELYS